MAKGLERVLDGIKRKTLPLILVSGFALINFSPTYNTTDFKVSCPHNWTSTELSALLFMGSGKGVLLCSPSDKEEIQVISRKLGQEETLESFINDIKKKMNLEKQSYQKIDISPIKLSDQNGYQIEYLYKEKVRGKWCYTAKNNKIYTICYVDKIDNFNDNLYIMNEVIKSFRIK